jgi:7-cyano-7-deazaguanine synthase
MKDTVLIYSGGLDSTSALHIYKDQIALAISFNYGSKHNGQEIKMAKLNCERLAIPHKVIYLDTIFSNIKSALLSDGPIPHGHYAEDNMRSTVVPFRNGIMLSIATGIAESNGLTKIMLASHMGDNAQYPDCTQEFNRAMSSAIRNGTWARLELVAPFAKMDKRQIAEMGVKYGMVPNQTYSCYEGNLDVHCGRCGTCVERIWALANITDTTLYRDTEYAKNLLKESGEW